MKSESDWQKKEYDSLKIKKEVIISVSEKRK
ncbi:hypothetical protein T283_12515 [Listeria monocytogenes N53-1]|nr:hypothetical protein AX10_08225 [Listeria monocytogenes WSLC1001]EZH69592.1 hypothetical protein T283_12515 [Listeria monocytogenes N53-1]